jgi:putative oxidoreductase
VRNRAHLFVVGGNPVPAIVLLLVTAGVAWVRRASFGAVLGGRD